MRAGTADTAIASGFVIWERTSFSRSTQPTGSARRDFRPEENLVVVVAAEHQRAVGATEAEGVS